MGDSSDMFNVHIGAHDFGENTKYLVHLGVPGHFLSFDGPGEMASYLRPQRRARTYRRGIVNDGAYVGRSLNLKELDLVFGGHV